MSDTNPVAREIIEGVVEHARALERLVECGNGQYQLETLLKVHDWAVAQQRFQVGDTIRVQGGGFPSTHGYSHWNDVWATRPTGVVERISFNGAHLYWSFDVRVDMVPDKVFGFAASQLTF